MATTIGPDMPTGAPKVGNVVDTSTRHVPLPITIDNATPIDGPGSSSQHSPRMSPPPNPHFVFPMKPASPSTSSAPSSYSRATGRRPRSVVDLSDRPSSSSVNTRNEARGSRPSALPDFSFNPGLGLSPPEHPFLSPPLSPASPRSIPAKPAGAGHRRGGSEFVGGKLRDGENITVMSTSPTKLESGFASPTLAPTRGPPRGRGHAHRRSAAISSHDLSAILQPTSPNPSVPRGNSAPNSPADFERNKQENYSFPEIKPEPSVDDSARFGASETLSQDAAVLPGSASVDEVKPTPRPATRARVGFSDTLEFIPRPLSLVSNDTSSTVTARPGGHSVSGSISSIISLTPSTSADRGMSSPPLSRSPSRSTDESRPSTAGAILEHSAGVAAGEPTGASPRRRNSIPLLVSLPEPSGTPTSPADPSPIKTPKRWSFFGLEPWSGANSPTRSRPISSSSSPELPATVVKSASTSNEHIQMPDPAVTGASVEEVSASPKTAAKKSKKKKKAARGWAGSILSRKSKPRRKSRRAPTPENVRGFTTDSADATTPNGTPTLLITESEPEPDHLDLWEPANSPPANQDDETSFSMIDLDAALGPFNTPLPRNPEWEAAQKAGGLTKRQLHSAAGMSRFTGPGMHYSHRRTESAPEMPPFNRSGMMRFSSNSTMADVFEEDEEDDESDYSSDGTPTETKAEMKGDMCERHSIDIRVTDSDDSASEVVKETPDDTTSSVGLSRRGSGLSAVSDDDRAPPSKALRPEYSASSLHDEIIFEESSVFALRSGDSGCNIVDGSDSATPSPRRILKTKDLTPVDVSPLHLPTPSLVPVSPYSMTHSSAFPSPRSPMSYDGNRVSTAPSSITEDNFQSLLMGEPGPELRLSSDIPSLTSSNSTMTRESAFVQFPPQQRASPYQGERPASFTASAFGRRRSSLASLHRLISTSHGERSKLSMEVSFNEPDKKPKPSKAKRLSRMMQFWKPKEAKEQSSS